MENLTCPQCRGEIVLREDGKQGVCQSCGCVFHFKNEKKSNLIVLLNQANLLRLKGDFDSAILAYKNALLEDDADADIYWGLVLSIYGVEYVEDKSGVLVPTCRRIQKQSIFENNFYKLAIENASEEQMEDFSCKAKQIDFLQKNIYDKLQHEEDFSVFLCYKSEDNGVATEDRFIARNIYNELSKRGIKTFFSEVTLKDRLGKDYEPIIYKALYSCQVFILIATQETYIQSAWVKNEWTRFRDRCQDERLENCSFAVFKNIDINQLPPFLKNQGINIDKYPAGGYEIEIADNLELRFKRDNSDKNSDNILMGEILSADKVVDLLDKKLTGTRETCNQKIDRALAYFEIGEKDKSLNLLEATALEYPRKSFAWFSLARVLSDDFNLDKIIQFYENDEVKNKFLYNLNIAARFATEKEKNKQNEMSCAFLEKLNLIKKANDYCNEFQNKTEQLASFQFELDKLKNELDSFNNEPNMAKERKIEIEKEIKILKNRKNSYYIKDVEIEHGWFQSFMQTLSCTIFLIALVNLIINLVKNLFSFLSITLSFLLFLLTFVPIIFNNIINNRKKIQKMSDIVDKDKKKLQNLREELVIIENNLHKAEQSQELYDRINEKNNEINNIKRQLNEIHNSIAKMCEDSILKNFVVDYNIRKNNEIDKMILTETSNIKALEAERVEIEDEILSLKKFVSNQSPKYFNAKYEKILNKKKELLSMYIKRIAIIDEEILKLNHHISTEKDKLNTNLTQPQIEEKEN